MRAAFFRCAEGSGEMLVDSAVKLLRGLHREATNQPAE
jgi:hypothetical protein